MSYANPPCASCTNRVSIGYNKKAGGEKKIEKADCCGAPVCDRCGAGGFCIFCKRPILSTSVVRKTSYSNWNAKFLEFWRLESLTREPFFFEFLKNSKFPLDYIFPSTIQLKLRLYIDSQVIPCLFSQVIQFRLSTPKYFTFRTPHDIKTFQKMYSIINSKDFVRIYQQHFHKSAVVVRYSRKYTRFGCIFFISLKLSTMLLRSTFLSDVNAIRRIICRITKKN